MMRFVASVCLAGLVACGGESGEVPPETPDDVAPPATFAEQVAVGQQLYGDSCASCHGASGEGLKAPRLVGLEQGALPLDPPATATVRTTQFRTAADVAAFVVAKMPPGNPGSLAESEYWAILAFALHANGVDLTRTLDAASAATVVLHKE